MMLVFQTHFFVWLSIAGKVSEHIDDVYIVVISCRCCIVSISVRERQTLRSTLQMRTAIYLPIHYGLRCRYVWIFYLRWSQYIQIFTHLWRKKFYKWNCISIALMSTSSVDIEKFWLCDSPWIWLDLMDRKY